MIEPVGVSENKSMTKLFWNVIKLSPVVVAATFCASSAAFANEANQQITPVSSLSQESNSMGQVTSVSQFSDVQPTDWAFQALQSLVERYGCIAGYPNGTFRGNRAMTRYEFAAGLNACLDRVNELIATATADLVKKEDLATLQRLQEEFSAELATLRGRVDALEARTSQLEANQFSTTTKLVGEAIFSVSDTFGGKQAIGSRTLINDTARTAARRDLQSNTTFSDRVRLNLLSSFTGKDQLQVRLQSGNIFNNNTSSLGSAATGTNMTRLIYDTADTTNSTFIEKLNYAFPLTDAVRVKVDANAGEFYANINTFNADLSDPGKGAVTRYSRFSPIYRQGQGGAGATISFNPKNSPINASVGYLAGGRNNVANNPSDGRGLVDGNYAAIAQLGFQPSKSFNLGLTYAHTYQNVAGGVNLFEGTGSDLAAKPFVAGTTDVATAANHYGVQANFKASDNISVGGWYGYSTAEAQTNYRAGATAGATAGKGDSADFNYWAATLTLKDFGSKGNLLGFVFGQPPKIASSDSVINGVRQKDANTSYHLETLYRMQLNDHISVTPSLLVIFNPENNDRNDTVYVGTLRTTFNF